MDESDQRMETLFRIAAILSEDPKGSETLLSQEQLSKPLRLAGYYLGQGLDEKVILASLECEMPQEAPQKLLLAQSARYHGARCPDMQLPLPIVLEGASAGFIRGFSGNRTRLPGRIRQTAGWLNGYHEHLGLDPDVQLIADDVLAFLKGAEHRIAALESFDDLASLASACIFAGAIQDRGLQKKARESIAGNLYDAEELMRQVAHDYLLSHVTILSANHVTELLAKAQPVKAVATNALVLLNLECNINHESLDRLAFEVDDVLGDSFHCVLLDSRGYSLKLLQKVVECKDVQEANILLNKAGFREEKEVDQLVESANSCRYRGIVSMDDLLRFFDELPARILKSSRYDDSETEFKEGDAAVIVHPFGICRYRYHDRALTPEKVPPGSQGNVVKSMAERVWVRVDGKEYTFDRTELAKPAAEHALDDLVRIDLGGAESKVKDMIYTFVQPLRIKHRCLFDPRRYKDALRSAIADLNEAGFSVDEIQELLRLRKLGIVAFSGNDDSLVEWLPGRSANVRVVRSSLPSEPLARVTEIFERHPAIVPYADLQGSSGEERSLMQYFLFDKNTGFCNDFLKGENPVERYVLCMLGIHHSIDTKGLDEQVVSFMLGLDAIKKLCAVAVYQSLIGVKRPGRQTSYMQEIPDKEAERLRSVLEKVGELSSPRPDDVEAHIARGKFHIIGEHRQEPYSQPFGEVKYDPAKLLSFKLFQGLKGGNDSNKAAECYMSMASGYGCLIQKAETAKDLRFLLGAALMAQGQPLEKRSSFQQVFLDAVLVYIRDAAEKKLV